MPINLNRIFTINASEESTMITPIAWRYNRYAEESSPGGIPTTTSPSLGGYTWGEGNGEELFTAVDTSAEIIAIATNVTFLQLGYNSVNQDGSANANLPTPGAVLRGSAINGKQVRFYLESEYPDGSYLSFIADRREEYPSNNSLFREYFFIEIRQVTDDTGTNYPEITLHGSPFNIPSKTTPIIITVQGQETSTIVSDPIEYPGVWGQLIERGATQSIQAAGTLLVTSAEATATLTVRYRPELAVGQTVDDDLGRHWRVETSRIIRDRRFIEYDLVRAVPVI